jgi:hypothetical protein
MPAKAEPGIPPGVVGNGEEEAYKRSNHIRNDANLMRIKVLDV